MAIIWDEKYSVEVSIIDEQHKQFLWIMDKLSKAVSSGETKEVLDQVIHDLEQYSIYHFNTEEKYFKEFNYEGADEHIATHRKFVEKLSEVKEKYSRDQFKLSLELISFVSDWLVNHINDMDRKYIETFHKNGLR